MDQDPRIGKPVRRALIAEKWPLWKLVAVPAMFFGVWALIPIFFLGYSAPVLSICVILIIVGVVGVVLVGHGQRRIGQIAVVNAWFLMILLMGARGWFVLVENTSNWFIWMTIIIFAYILAWFLPTLNPKLSAFIWKEQYSPETNFGKAFLGFSAKMLPIAGSGGALIGMYGTRSGQDNLAALLVGILATLVPVGWAQVASHQFWREDQRRDQEQPEVDK